MGHENPSISEQLYWSVSLLDKCLFHQQMLLKLSSSKFLFRFRNANLSALFTYAEPKIMLGVRGAGEGWIRACQIQSNLPRRVREREQVKGRNRFLVHDSSTGIHPFPPSSASCQHPSPPIHSLSLFLPILFFPSPTPTNNLLAKAGRAPLFWNEVFYWWISHSTGGSATVTVKVPL